MSEPELNLLEQRELREELLASFNGPPPLSFLADIGFPREAYPDAGLQAVDAWLHVIQQVAAGGPVDFPTVLNEARRRYPRSAVLERLQRRCTPGSSAPPQSGPAADSTVSPDSTTSPGEVAPDLYGARPNVQAFIQAAEGEDRRKVMAELADLTPTLRSETNSTMLVEFATADVDRAFRQLERLPMEWTVVEPGQPAYLISRLIVQGPDGRRFRLGDIPASTLIQDLASTVLMEYPSPGGARGVVADRVLPNDQGERLRPDHTLHEANVRDGERIRVGRQTSAGAVNPTLREEALTRARNQLLEFAAAHGWGLVADAPERATVYEVTFTRPSFGPPPPPNGPGTVNEHTVQIVFGPDFPQSAPSVYWLTPVFHPNIYPNYDCDEALAHPQLQGYVCLGELEDGYQPGLALGDLCLMLLDLAGFRNYSLQVPTGEVVRTVSGLVVAGTGNALDTTAARWVRDNQDRLPEVDGLQLERSSTGTTRRPYRHLVEPLDP